MPLSKKPVSCIPCAKRKVRCDRLQPCCHCKRRKQDTCVYPDFGGITDERFREQAVRIEKLEDYVRDLGGNPNESNVRARLETTQVDKPPEHVSAVISRPIEGGAALASRTQRLTQTTSRLLENDGDGNVTYIETPMWHSWRGRDDESSAERRNAQASKPHYQGTILDPIQQTDVDNSFEPLPPQPHLCILWPHFLKNVHPLVKIFFDWEVEPIIQRAQSQGILLPVGEQALVNGICFIAISALSREECRALLSEEKPELQIRYQRRLECVLLLSGYAETTDRHVLQGFILYLLAMRNRARPAAIYSLMGIACRIAERMGLHRDGSVFGLCAARCEERRRMWWQLQYMEIAVARLVGNISLSVFAGWDTKIPSNLEDSDFSPDLKAMPAERKGLTNMSPCLWRYSIIQMNRESPGKTSFEKMTWPLSPHVPIEEKEAKIDSIEKMLAERFLQYCELLNPLHVHLQIGIRQFVLAARSNARQPSLANAKISEMTQKARDEMLEICSKSLEYFVLSQTSPSLLGFQWSNDTHFQVASFVYLVLEAHQRYNVETVADLWSLIGRVYDVHPDLLTAADRPEVVFIARITISAWHKYDSHIRQTQTSVNNLVTDDTPEWVRLLCRNFDVALVDEVAQSLPAQILPTDFDFDMIDWSTWETYLLQGSTEFSAD